MRKTSGNQHLLSIFKRQHRTVSMTKGFSRVQIHSHIEKRTMQTGHQLCLGVFPFLKMQTTQRERFPAVSLIDLSNSEIYRLVVWHGKISSEVFKGRYCEYYWLCVHFVSFLLFSFQTICFEEEHSDFSL